MENTEKSLVGYYYFKLDLLSSFGPSSSQNVIFYGDTFRAAFVDVGGRVRYSAEGSCTSFYLLMGGIEVFLLIVLL